MPDIVDVGVDIGVPLDELIRRPSNFTPVHLKSAVSSDSLRPKGRALKTISLDAVSPACKEPVLRRASAECSSRSPPRRLPQAFSAPWDSSGHQMLSRSCDTMQPLRADTNAAGSLQSSARPCEDGTAEQESPLSISSGLTSDTNNEPIEEDYYASLPETSRAQILASSSAESVSCQTTSASVVTPMSQISEVSQVSQTSLERTVSGRSPKINFNPTGFKRHENRRIGTRQRTVGKKSRQKKESSAASPAQPDMPDEVEFHFDDNVLNNFVSSPCSRRKPMKIETEFSHPARRRKSTTPTEPLFPFTPNNYYSVSTPDLEHSGGQEEGASAGDQRESAPEPEREPEPEPESEPERAQYPPPPAEVASSAVSFREQASLPVAVSELPAEPSSSVMSTTSQDDIAPATTNANSSASPASVSIQLRHVSPRPCRAETSCSLGSSSGRESGDNHLSTDAHFSEKFDEKRTGTLKKAREYLRLRTFSTDGKSDRTGSPEGSEKRRSRLEGGSISLSKSMSSLHRASAATETAKHGLSKLATHLRKPKKSAAS